MKTGKCVKALMQVWSADSLKKEVKEALEKLALTEDVRRIAVMPDIHMAGNVCVGCVTGAKNHILPEAIGGDIGCGMAAVRFNCKAEILTNSGLENKLMDVLSRKIPSQRHSRSCAPPLSDFLSGFLLSDSSLEKIRNEDGTLQFATLGSGNHFVEFQSDEEGFLWLMVHSGSRAIGQSIHQRHMKNTERTKTGMFFLEAESSEGKGFLSDHQFAVEYARESRIRMVSLIKEIMADIFKIPEDPDSFIECTHNFVRREMHFGEELWVHRKGAISAKAGEPGMIPGSMGSPSFHISGRGCEASLCSASHGAGREMSRQEARQKISQDAFSKQMNGIFFDRQKSRLLLDEAPQAYKDISAVMRAQTELVRIDRKLFPILNYKGT